MNSDIVLTPAQVEFLSQSLNGFSLNNWPIELAGQAASQRRFIRVSEPSPGNKSYILVIWDSRDEDWPRFITLTDELKEQIPFLPKLYNRDDRHGLLLEEDLGAMTVKKYCMSVDGDPVAIERIYMKVIEALCEWQKVDPSTSKVISSRAMDLETFLWETSYFARHCVTDYFACEKMLTKEWDQERARLASEAASLPRTCIHRDFQSENVLVHQGNIRFVDFQGARLGPPEYDTASLLFDPYIPLLDELAIDRLFRFYRPLSPVNGTDTRSFYICAAQRLMQALGAYGNLSIHKGKGWYREHIPVALNRLRNVLEKLPDFPHTTTIIESCIDACTLVQKTV